MKIPDWVKGGVLAAVLICSVPLLYFGCSYFVTTKIALQNFNEAEGRAKISRAKSDLVSYKTALEAYYVDNNSYPPIERLALLTTPVSYFNQPSAIKTSPLKPDVFSEDKEPYYYYRNGQHLLVGSRGPDQDIDLQLTDSQEISDSQLRLMQYDPTNGSRSAGDVIYY